MIIAKVGIVELVMKSANGQNHSNFNASSFRLLLWCINEHWSCYNSIPIVCMVGGKEVDYDTLIVQELIKIQQSYPTLHLQQYTLNIVM